MLKRDFISEYIHIKYTKYLFPKFRKKLLNFYAYKKNFDWTK